MRDRNQSLWAITAYFNPARYRRRLQNFKCFRKHLGVPLLAVELAGSTEFELTSDDAEILVQIRSSCVLWQKEKLLNLAVQRLPKSVRFVAWLDCDVLFERVEWAEETQKLLGSVPIGQPFSHLFELEPGLSDVPDVVNLEKAVTQSLASKVVTQHSSAEIDFLPQPDNSARSGGGFAWAARRDLLDKHGFYDAMILGGGDRAIAGAAYGRFEDPVQVTVLNPIQRSHYMQWAHPFFDDVQGRVGCIRGGLFHLWHGDLQNRRYFERHRDLTLFNFNPFTDLETDKQGCWSWKSDNTQLHRYLEQYFETRKEDGE